MVQAQNVGLPFDGPVEVFCNNQGKVKNVSLPQPALSKNYDVINFHVVCEAAAAGILQVFKEETEMNFGDLFTKVMQVPRWLEQLGSVL